MSKLIEINLLKRLSSDNKTVGVVLTKNSDLSLLPINLIKNDLENYYTKSQLNTQLASYIKKDGSVPLTADWNLGSFRIKINK